MYLNRPLSHLLLPASSRLVSRYTSFLLTACSINGPAGSPQRPPLDSDVCRRLAWIQFNYDKQPAHLLGPWLKPGTSLDKEIPSQSHHGRFMRHPARLFCLMLFTSAPQTYTVASMLRACARVCACVCGGVFIIHTPLVMHPCPPLFNFGPVFISKLRFSPV